MEMNIEKLKVKYAVNEVISTKEFYDSWIDYLDEDDTGKKIKYEDWDIITHVDEPGNNVEVKEVEEGYIVDPDDVRTLVLRE